MGKCLLVKIIADFVQNIFDNLTLSNKTTRTKGHPFYQGRFQKYC